MGTDYSRQGRINRNKGKDGQREFGRHFIELLSGLEWDHPDQTMSVVTTAAHPDDIFRGTPVDSFHIETKKWKKLRPRLWIAQAGEDAGGAPWLIAFKRPGPIWRQLHNEWYVLIPVEVYDHYGEWLRRASRVFEKVEGPSWNLTRAIKSCEAYTWVLWTIGLWDSATYPGRSLYVMPARLWARALKEGEPRE